jgi:ankyrin repeat protein
MIYCTQRLFFFITLLLFQESIIFPFEEAKLPDYQENSIIRREKDIDDIITLYPQLDQGFQLLYDRQLLNIQMTNLLKSPFYNYLDQKLIIENPNEDDDQDPNFGEVIHECIDLIVDRMKKPYREDFIKFIQNPYQCAPAIVVYVLGQKNRGKVIVAPVLKSWINENTNIDGKILLHEAVSSSYILICQELIAAGADVNLRNTKGETPLFKAVEQDDMQIAEILVHAGADINARKDFGLVPLHTVKSAAMVHFLVSHGASLTAKDICKHCALFHAVESSNLEVMQALFSLNPKFCKQLSCKMYTWSFAKQNKVIAKELLSYNFNPNLCHKGGLSLLFKACEINDVELIQLLIAAGARCDLGRKNPLKYAVDHNYVESVEALLKAPDIHLDKQDKDGQTLLYRSVKDNKIEVARKILIAGANPNITPQGSECIWFLTHDIEFLQLLLHHGFHKNYQNNCHESLLLHAIKTRKIKKVQLLISAEADPNCLDMYDKTALYYGVKAKYIEGVDALLHSPQIDLNIQNGYLGTILHIAVCDNNIEMVEKLIAAKLNVNNKDQNGNTPLHIAVKNNSSYLVTVLLKANADLDLQNNDGYIPIELARNLAIRNMISAEEHRREFCNSIAH